MRTRLPKEYLVILFIIAVSLVALYRITPNNEVQQLRHEIEILENSLRSESKAQLDKVTDSHRETSDMVKRISDFISKLNERTNEISAKVPELEGKLSEIDSVDSSEKKGVGEYMNQLRDTYESLQNKIGALEGVISDLYSHHEQHEAEHAKEEAEEREQAAQQQIQKEKEEAAAITAKEKDERLSTVLLIVASSKRPDYLRRTLQHVAEHHPKTSVSVLVSEDGQSTAVDEVVREAFRSMRERGVTVPMMHIHHPAHAAPAQNGYFKLSRHFKWALHQVFSTPVAAGAPVAKRVIILEEDLQIAPDFFEFFAAVAPMIDSDETLLAASAWNDNGVKGMVRDPKALYRSDFFPGLGWMMSRRVWNELEQKWPKAYWDDWLREPEHRKGRHTIRPEICRTFHFGKSGVSNGQYSKFIDEIQLNTEFVPFTSMDLTYLQSTTWDREYISRVLEAPLIEPTQAALTKAMESGVNEVRVAYSSLEGRSKSFVSIANWIGAMSNIKANVPRTAYRGVVSVWRGNTKIHIVPVQLVKSAE